MKKEINWGRIASAWAALEREIGPLDFALTESNADRIAAIVGSLLQVTQDDTPRSLHGMLDALSNWLSEYEKKAVQVQATDPAELLQHLMESNGMKQRDLAPLVGGQSIVSAILNGRRRINARQAVELGRRFSLSPVAFLSTGTPESDSPPPVSCEPVVHGIELGGNGATMQKVTAPPAGRAARKSSAAKKAQTRSAARKAQSR